MTTKSKLSSSKGQGATVASWMTSTGMGCFLPSSVWKMASS